MLFRSKILVACEESQAVTIEMRRLGHEAYSCDIEPVSYTHLTVAFLKYQFGVIPVQNADIPVLSSEYGREFMCRIGTCLLYTSRCV